VRPVPLATVLAFLEMVIDPVCSIVFQAESAEPDAMRPKPRDPEAALLLDETRDRPGAPYVGRLTTGGMR
jgi:hypothetical protein